MRYELTDHEWAAIKPMQPNKPRGVSRVNDRRVDQALSASRNPLRQARGQLPRIHPTCVDQAMAAH